MNESDKTFNKFHPYLKKYINSPALDIGSGSSCVNGCLPFDVEHGDANKLTDKNFQELGYPTKYSTIVACHVLEHMFDPYISLLSWWECVSKDGYLIVIVPDEVLYEQLYWPSIFSDDHKFSFRLTGSSPLERSINLSELAAKLPDSEIVYSETHDDKYDLSFINFVKSSKRTHSTFKFFYWKVLRKIIKSILFFHPKVFFYADKFSSRISGYGFDQTRHGALAQNCVVIKKIN